MRDSVAKTRTLEEVNQSTRNLGKYTKVIPERLHSVPTVTTLRRKQSICVPAEWLFGSKFLVASL